MYLDVTAGNKSVLLQFTMQVTLYVTLQVTL